MSTRKSRLIAGIAVALVTLACLQQSSCRKTKLRDISVREAAAKDLFVQERGSAEKDRFWIEILSWEPRAFLFHTFLTDGEADYLVQLAKPHMEKSEVVDNETGKSQPSEVRTSSGMFLNRGEDDIVDNIEARIAKHTAIPRDNGEGLQILHYQASEQYRPHFDYFHDKMNTVNGGQRLATLLMYLSDVQEGGETVFPDSVTKPNAGKAGFSTCAQAGVAAKPKKGDALFFYSQTPSNQLDEKSLHAGCPVIRGDKWSATKWMRVDNFEAGWIPREGLAQKPP
ncbi:g1022 [Coccomyxa viridis]|uniref:G1022 protein n=1 Tax=Coccomyxa viridis TaxID=1274662 RepID=A0ABP1FKZ5_9CHLO